MSRPHSSRRHRARGGKSFRCLHCRLDVSLDAPGTRNRNHCPNCLWSRHLDDDVPGDRDADCGAAMEPIAITVRGDGEWVLVHCCRGCAELHLNRTAGDDNALLLMRLAVEPLVRSPFPVELLSRVESSIGWSP